MNTRAFGLGRERYFIYCALWLGSAFLFTAFGAADAVEYYRLRRQGIPTEGRAVAQAPHYQITYSFEVNGAAYQGVGMTGFGTAPFEQIRIGDKLPVYYLSKDPKINCLRSPDKLFSNELIFVLLMVILGPTMITAVAVFRYERRLRRLYGTGSL